MSNEDAKNIWNYILEAHAWDNIEEVEATSDEIKILEAYHSGDPDYQADISSTDLKRELGI